VSVDSPTRGRRERDQKHRFFDLPPGMCCENMREPADSGKGERVRSIEFAPELSWEHIAWLRSVTKLPIVLKGLMHPDDARLAVEHGASALIVSNHGGRQLDTVPASIELLPDIVDAVAGAVPLVVDGGIRRGTDVVKALALGAKAVALGRPVLFGLAIGGAQGVVDLLEMLRAEVADAFALCGARTTADLKPDLLRWPRREVA
jgi:4-hydroxymandelate oxidase